MPVPKTGLYPKKLVYKFGPGAEEWEKATKVDGIDVTGLDDNVRKSSQKLTSFTSSNKGPHLQQNSTVSQAPQLASTVQILQSSHIIQKPHNPAGNM